ncbi:LTA synthase family protein [Candidatus Avelusimicrobium aviculae]|uniref:LTA synthase family protein n=1 Tax=Candidatus Avelusimicrobium aviculae TaxID=3416206 RepID=UPI003D0E8448
MWIKKPQKTDFRFRWSIYIVLLAALMFTAARLALFECYHSLFAALTAQEIKSAFLNGLRFDFSCIALFLGPLVFLLNLPVNSRRWAKWLLYIISLVLLILAGLLAADLIYFPKVNRHIAEEIIQISHDWDFVISYMFGPALWPLLGLLAVFAAAIFFIRYKIKTSFKPEFGSPLAEGGKLLLIIILIVMGIRGHLGIGKSLGVADVYNYAQTPSAAALTLNGAFTAYQVGRKGQVDIENPFPAEEAILIAREELFSPDEIAADARYPLMRTKQEASNLKDINIMIVLLEGWHPRFVDSLSGGSYGVTPVFDKIVSEGVVFNNAYASGLRSMFGFAAVLAGVPLVPGLPMFGYGLEMNALSSMPKNFSDAGYYTLFAQTSKRDSYRLCALASFLGMQDSYGWEDIPELLPYEEKAPFGYDYDALMFAADKIKNRKEKNFFAMVFTGITHEPFARTLPQFDKYTGDDWDSGFKNTLAYADWSIGEFLEKAKQDGWFDNTIFIFVADHTSGAKTDSLYDKFRIPLVMYAPKILPAVRRNITVSQMDLAPTIYALTGLSVPYTAFGRNIFDRSRENERFAFVSEGVNIGLITPKGAIRHSGTQLLSTEALQDDFDPVSAAKKLQALDKAAYTLLKENRWFEHE